MSLHKYEVQIEHTEGAMHPWNVTLSRHGDDMLNVNGSRLHTLLMRVNHAIVQNEEEELPPKVRVAPYRERKRRTA